MVAVRIDSLFPSAVSDLSDDSLSSLYARADRSKPWLRVNFVSSVDGAATIDGVSGGLGGDADRRVFDLLRELCDVVIVGAGTVRGEGYGPMVLPPRSVDRRASEGLPPHPVFAIVSNRLDLDPSSRIFTEAPVRPNSRHLVVKLLSAIVLGMVLGVTGAVGWEFFSGTREREASEVAEFQLLRSQAADDFLHPWRPIAALWRRKGRGAS